MRIFSFSAVTLLHLNLIRSVVNKQQYPKYLKTTMPSTQDSNDCEPLVRRDGLKINYDPHAPEMVEKYGAPGMTDDEGFNPYTDSVGPGIYGGRVKRDVLGEIKIGSQYQVLFQKKSQEKLSKTIAHLICTLRSDLKSTLNNLQAWGPVHTKFWQSP